MVEAAGETLVETSVEVTVETRVIVEVSPWMVAVGAVATLVELEMISTRTPHVTLSGKPWNSCSGLLLSLGRRAARRSDRAGVAAAARFLRRPAEEAEGSWSQYRSHRMKNWWKDVSSELSAHGTCLTTPKGARKRVTSSENKTYLGRNLERLGLWLLECWSLRLSL